MAYEFHNITAITDVPALVGSFAQSIGWEADLSTPTQPIISRPQGHDSNSGSNSASPLSDAIRWRITAIAAGSNHVLSAEAYEETLGVITTTINSRARFLAPSLTSGIQTPHTVYLVGSMNPEPYLGIIVEYPGQIFPHMYIGNMEKIGNYEGGEVVSATDGPANSTANLISYTSYDHMKYLFQSKSNRQAFADCGGVYVDHPSNATKWRRFRGVDTSTNPHQSMPTGIALGGFLDSINDGYLARARSPFAGQSVLVPINLYANENIVGDAIYRPIGRPAGIRMVNMQDLQPGQEIIVGGKLFRCFPSHCRRFETQMTRTGSGGLVPRDFETSLWVGYAYAVDEEDSNSAGA